MVLRIVTLAAIVSALILMSVQPDLHHEYVLGPVRVTRYALTQWLLGVFIVSGLANEVIVWMARRRKASRR